MTKDKILAKVNDIEISRSDVEALRQVLGNRADIFKGKEGIEALREELINQELLYRDAKKKKMDEDEEFIKAFEQTKRQMLQQYALSMLISGISVSPDQAEDYYKQNKEAIDKAFVSEKQNSNASFEKVKDQLIYQLTLMKQQEKYKNYLSSLEKEYNIERYEIKEEEHD